MVAARFLNRFTDGLPWALIDMGAHYTVDEETDLCPAGASGFGVRFLDFFAAGYEKSRALLGQSDFRLLELFANIRHCLRDFQPVQWRVFAKKTAISEGCMQLDQKGFVPLFTGLRGAMQSETRK